MVKNKDTTFLILIDENGIYWLVEIKDDNNPNPEIEEKNQAAKEWVNALNLELGEEERRNGDFVYY